MKTSKEDRFFHQRNGHKPGVIDTKKALLAFRVLETIKRLRVLSVNHPDCGVESALQKLEKRLDWAKRISAHPEYETLLAQAKRESHDKRSLDY